jgi:hypothetical protein
MVNYLLGKIYKIVNNNNNEIYIGSTCEPILARRLAGHVYDYKGYLTGKRSYVTSFKIIESGNFNIILIEQYPCENKDQLLSRERYYIDTLDCVNKCRAGAINELGLKEYTKKYHIENIEKIKDQKNKKFNCACGGKYTHTNRIHHLKTPLHQNYLNNPLNNHAKIMEQTDNFLDDIQNFINNQN